MNFRKTIVKGGTFGGRSGLRATSEKDIMIVQAHDDGSLGWWAWQGAGERTW